LRLTASRRDTLCHIGSYTMRLASGLPASLNKKSPAGILDCFVPLSRLAIITDLISSHFFVS